jgi:methyl-accepting chemotaxis protein
MSQAPMVRTFTLAFGVGGTVIALSRAFTDHTSSRTSWLEAPLGWLFLGLAVLGFALPFMFRAAPGQDPVWMRWLWSLLLMVGLWFTMSLALPWLAGAAFLGGLTLFMHGQFPLAQASAEVTAEQTSAQVDLQTHVRQLGQNAQTMQVATKGVRQVTSAQIEATHHQGSTIAQVAAALSQITATSSQTVEHAETVVASAETSEQISQQGIESVSQNIEGLHRISEQVETITANIFELNEQTNQIGDIVASSSEVAERSHVLALNASVEAARAGEAGKGFQVVAQEMKNLARQSKRATERIRRILTEIQRASQSVVAATEEGSRRVTAGIHLAQQAGEIIKQLSQVISGSADSARMIAEGSRQLSTGIEQIAVAVGDLTGATESIMRQGRELSTVVGELEQTSEANAALLIALEGDAKRSAASVKPPQHTLTPAAV